MLPISTLMQGDCLDEMKKFDAGCIDLTVTSPPYDNLRDYNKSLNDWSEAKWKAIIAELYRVTKDGGVVVWVVADATINGSETGTSFRQALHAMECGFRLHDTMIYHRNRLPLNHNRYEQHFEYMFVWSKGSPKSFSALLEPCKKFGANDFRKARGGRHADGTQKDQHGKSGYKETKPRSNIWFFATGHNCSTLDKEAFKHPAIFPEALARDHILSWSNEGDTVFDPFLGSGTTGKMAVTHGRNFIGVERDASYFEIAERRIAEALREPEQPLLFAAE